MKDAEFRPTGEPTRAPRQRHTSPPRRILVADDESAIGHFSADSMVGHGCYADAAEDGAVAWKAVQAKQFDLPIHDNFMSNFTGIELVKYLIRVHAFCNQT